MIKAVKVIAFLLCVGAVILAYLAITESKRADYWRTEPMRKARHRKPEPEPEPEPQPEPEPVTEKPEQNEGLKVEDL